jgi:hypothetical protein
VAAKKGSAVLRRCQSYAASGELAFRRRPRSAAAPQQSRRQRATHTQTLICSINKRQGGGSGFILIYTVFLGVAATSGSDGVQAGREKKVSRSHPRACPACHLENLQTPEWLVGCGRESDLSTGMAMEKRRAEQDQCWPGHAAANPLGIKCRSPARVELNGAFSVSKIAKAACYLYSAGPE